MNLHRALFPALALAFAAGCGCGPKGPLPAKPAALVGHCVYVNGFSKRTECKEYRGTKWTETEATRDCKGNSSNIVLGEACSTDKILGECVLGEPEKYSWLYFPGEDAAACGSMKRGCEFFAGGTFGPAPICGGVEPGTGGTGLPTFQWPELSCRDPKPGEPAGRGPGGKVCTWEAISGATEEGRNFADYASCDRVRTQRPYHAAPITTENPERDDPRLQDPAYAAEHTWVKQQINATACGCCHSTSAPEGPANWYLEQKGNFINGFSDRAIAMGAGWVDTVSFGAYPPEQNNGFHRPTPSTPNETMFVTTDQARMKRFFEGEAAARGLKKESFSGTYGGGPLDDQRFYRPKACEAGEGVAADGTMTWTQGPARYIYILEADSPSPGVPPNLDMPGGTVWRIDAPYTSQAIASGALKFGVVPEGFTQKMPADGSKPPALVSGRQYYIYVMADIALPNARCLFTAP